MATITLPDILADYPILSVLSEYISSLDFYNLARSCKASHRCIQPGGKVFNALCRQSLCDGHGLQARKAMCPRFYDRCNDPSHGPPGAKPMIAFEEEVEVYLYARQCDEAHALPCSSCGVNICDECRVLDRLELRLGTLERHPFPCPHEIHQNYFALCTSCDEKIVRQMQTRTYLNEDCDCDVWTRWTCVKCAKSSLRFSDDYEARRTKHWPGDEPSETKLLRYEHGDKQLYCLCGAVVPEQMRLRCTWCLRRVPPESEWEDIMNEGLEWKADPTYPVFMGANEGIYQAGQYPKLKYEGPVWTEAEREAHVTSLLGHTE